jgi:hypothetical protein
LRRSFAYLESVFVYLMRGSRAVAPLDPPMQPLDTRSGMFYRFSRQVCGSDSPRKLLSA